MIKQRQTPMRMPLQAKHNLLLLLIAALLTACNGASASPTADAAPARESRPTLVFVYADG